MYLHPFLSRWLVRSALLVVLVPFARAQPTPDAKWSSSEPHVRQAFGGAVALKGTVAFVGAPGYDPQFQTSNFGAAYVYRYGNDGWVEEQQLTKPEPEINDVFGRSVALGLRDIRDGTSNTLLVGTPNDDEVAQNAGAAFVFDYDGFSWGETQKLTASDGATADLFGATLAVDLADYTVWRGGVVGAPRHDLMAFSDEGAAYLYRYEDGAWVEDQKLTASDAATSAHFGEAVAISGNRVLIGAPGDRVSGTGQNTGAAYVFEYVGDEWVETAKLTASDAEGQADFGSAVALDGDRALIGARRDGTSGAAYVFELDEDEWAETAKLIGTDAMGLALFGSAVALDGAQALVGAERWFPEGEDATGKVYLFEYDEGGGLWLEVEGGLVPEDGGAGDAFGAAVALDDGVVLVGAPEHGLPVGGNGAVYAYGEPETQPIGVIASFPGHQPPFGRIKGVASGDLSGDGIADISVMQGCTLTVLDALTQDVLWEFSIDVEYSADGDDLLCIDDEVPPNVDIKLIGFVDFYDTTHALTSIEIDGGNRIIAVLIAVTDNEVVYDAEARVVAVIERLDGRTAIVVYMGEGGGIFNAIGEIGGSPPTAVTSVVPAPPFYSSRGGYQLDLKFQAEPGLRLGYDPALFNPPDDTDLDCDGVLDIPMLTVEDEQVDGTIVRSGITLDVLWEFTYPAEHRENLLRAYHGFADTDGDGENEVIMGDNLVVTLDGTVHTIAENFVTLDVNDIDGDGFEDIIGLSLPDSSVVVYGATAVTPSVEGTDPAAIPAFLFQNYPNPFRERTTIAYEIAQPGTVTITVYDMLGRRVSTLVDGDQPAGRHEVTWNGRNSGGRAVATGTYFYRLDVGGVLSSKQALHIR